MITIKEIAEMAGVSIGTVDRVIHKRGRVSPETIKRVNTIIKEKGYVPNIQARNLVLSKHYQIKVLMPYPQQDNGFWSRPAAGVDRAQKELAMFRVQTEKLFFDRYSEKDFIKKSKEAIASSPDGILIAPVLTESAIEFCQSIPPHISLVLFDTPLPGVAPLCFIGQNAYYSGKTCAHLLQYLVKDGRHIAAVQIIPADVHIQQRINGFCSFFAHKYQPRIFFIYHQDDKKEQRELLDKILNDGEKTEAVFVSNASVYNIAEEIAVRGLDIKIIGYDLTDTNRKLLEEQKIDFLISQCPDQQAYLGIRQLYRHLVIKEPVENQIIMPIDIIASENLQFYKSF
ncbi:MAG: LacI family DNA-binding transcriptional regulator [Spirochaetales bacterium]|nr:LacI family DNA-binding transcriptional regulator [Spirochaetales bacterium]